MTKYRVTEGCIGRGLCEEISSEVFSMTDEGAAKATKTEVPAECETAATEAMDGCPVGVIVEE